MNEKKTFYLSLREFTKTDSPFGNIQGKDVFVRLLETVQQHSDYDIFAISLKEIKATDASFPRESVVSLAKFFRETKGICLLDLSNQDLIDNWLYATEAKEQPLTIWKSDGSYLIIGPNLTPSANSLIDFVLANKKITATQAAAKLDLSIQNVSTQLKKLFKQGYILRSQDAAESGGLEFIYHAIK